jgi:hypothetical protein
MTTCKSSITDGGIPFSYLGPDLDQGPLPAVFYFALSGQESLSLDPYNQPAVALLNFPMRVFSLTLPGHEPGRLPNESMKAFAKEMEQDNLTIPTFVQKVKGCLTHLEKNSVLSRDKTGLMGLSRGGFITSHIAANEPTIKYVLQFAPLTKISDRDTFKDVLNSSSFNTDTLTDKLYEKTLRIYISNRDHRVGTENAFSFCQKLVEEAFSHSIRSPQIELILSAPIGHQGHGTTPKVFEEGASWLAKQLI